VRRVGTAEITALPAACASKCRGHADGVSGAGRRVDPVHGPVRGCRQIRARDERWTVHGTGCRRMPRGQTAGPRWWQKTALHSASLDGSSPLLWGWAVRPKRSTIRSQEPVDTWGRGLGAPLVGERGWFLSTWPWIARSWARIVSDGHAASCDLDGARIVRASAEVGATQSGGRRGTCCARGLRGIWEEHVAGGKEETKWERSTGRRRCHRNAAQWRPHA
jgi:hypothetical protein